VTSGEDLLKLTASDAAPFDRFGVSVAINETRAVIGSRGLDDTGSAYVFDVATGDELLKFMASDGAPGDVFGISVGVLGSLAIVGAPGSGSDGAGGAYLFNAETGQQLSKFSPLDATDGSQFGLSVAISDRIAVVGAEQADSAYLFDVMTGEQLHKLTASDDSQSGPPDLFGRSVAISNNVAVVGAFHDDEAGIDAGAAYVFNVRTGQELFKLTASDASDSDFFGYSVAIYGNTIVVGAKNADGGAGAAYVFDMPFGDTNGDGSIDIDDFNNVLNNFALGELGGPPIPGDAFPFDGVVDLADLNLVRNYFGKPASGAVAVPEPKGTLLLGAALCILTLRRI
jgi:outer membrane protein assembly factor BamB